MLAKLAPTNRHNWRYFIIPILSLLMSHGIAYGKLPFQEGYHFPWLSFLFMLTVGLFVCEFSLRNYHWLDGRFHSDHSHWNPVISKITLNVVMTSLFFLALILIMNWLISGSIPPPSRILTYVFIILLVTTAETMVFLLTDIYQKGKNISSPFLTIKSGTATQKINISDISCFHSNGGLVYVILDSGKRLVTQFNSFNQLKAKYKLTEYFHVNRQYLISRKCVDSILPSQNRKLKLILSIPSCSNGQHEIGISRYKSADFKNWLTKPDHSLSF